MQENTTNRIRFAAGRAAVCALLFAVSSALAAQSRDIPIYLPEPKGGTEEQRQYFFDNFKMELEGAKYPVVDSLEKSQYSMPLIIADNQYFGQAGEERYVLTIILARTKDSAEIVRFEFPFTDLQKMNEWNLFLVYRTMGNAVAYGEEPAAPEPPKEPPEPVAETPPEPEPAKEPPPPEPAAPAPDGSWRDSRLYAAGALGIDSGHNIPAGTNKIGKGFVMPSLSLGAEFQFLDFMAAELDVRLRMHADGERPVFAPAAALLLKGVWKPGASLMIEPYAGAEGAFGIGGEVPLLSAVAGAQAAFGSVWGGAVTLDFAVTASVLGYAKIADGKDYSVIRISVSAGYKFGWFGRNAGNSGRLIPDSPPEITSNEQPAESGDELNDSITP